MAQKVRLHKYSLGEELLNSISHGVGAALAIAGLIVGLVIAVNTGDPYKIASMTLYGVTLIILYTVSTIYHALKPNKGKKVMRVLDHCAIYLLIAGTYTPFSLVSLRGSIGWIVFGVCWGACILGIVLNAIDIKKYAIISMISYIATGWMIVFAFSPLTEVVAKNGIVLLIWGGIAYTVGAVLYGIGKKIKYIHSVWHFFVLAGSILHYFAVILYVI